MSETVINISKGERIDLTKGNAGLAIVHVGLGWDVASSDSAPFDLDASAFVLKTGQKLHSGSSSVIFFKNLHGPGIEHMGDNLTGVGEGDDETIKIDFSKLPAETEEVLIVVNIFSAETRNQNFGQVKNAFVRVFNPADNTELAKYDLSEDYSKFNAMIMGRVYKKDGEWKFQAVGEGKNGDLNVLAGAYL